MRATGIAVIATLALFGAAPAEPEELVELRDAFLQEGRLLDIEIEEYGTARERERRAIAELRDLNRRLDAAISDPNASPAEMIRMDSQIAGAIDEACAQAREAAAARRTVHQRMQRMQRLSRDVEALGVEIVGRSGAVGGMWRIEAQPIDVYGLLSLRQNGAMVEGSYRLSNGRHGSVRGTFAGEQIELQMVDSGQGPIGTIKGDLNSAYEEIVGRWQAMELGDGRPSGGEWTASLISADDVLDLR